MFKILVINGPNLNLYYKIQDQQKTTLNDIIISLLKIHKDIDFIQTNSTGVMIDAIQSASEYDGIIINVSDCFDECNSVVRSLKLMNKPTVEVNTRINKEISDLRTNNFTEFMGEPESTYRYALNWLLEFLDDDLGTIKP